MLQEIGQFVVENLEKTLEVKENIDNLKLKETPITEIQTIRADLAGKEHPETGIKYVQKTIELPDGKLYEGTFPEFPAKFEVQLDEGQYYDSDARQFRHANNELGASITENPNLAKEFSPQQLEQIQLGRTPDGYVWHHHETPGVLQLVDKEIHELTRHTGGRSLWGGGQDFR